MESMLRAFITKNRDTILEQARTRAAARTAPAATVTAFTKRARVTPEALRGADGALVVARVTRPGGTTVAVGPADPAEPLPVDDETDAPPPGVDDHRSGI